MWHAIGAYKVTIKGHTSSGHSPSYILRAYVNLAKLLSCSGSRAVSVPSMYSANYMNNSSNGHCDDETIRTPSCENISMKYSSWCAVERTFVNIIWIAL